MRSWWNINEKKARMGITRGDQHTKPEARGEKERGELLQAPYNNRKEHGKGIPSFSGK